MKSSSTTTTSGGPAAAHSSSTTSADHGHRSESQSPPPPTSSSRPRRTSNTTVCVPIVYGSIAFYLGKKADEYSTHSWTLYVRGPNDEDLSNAISKVVFQLHPSFPQPVRELTSPPFEVTEKGWGEFEAGIRILWNDPVEKPLLITHGIKLYPPGVQQIVNPTTLTSKEAVVHEFYDEVVFSDPTETFYQQLMRGSVLPRITNEELKDHWVKYSDEDDFKTLAAAQKFMDEELNAVKDRILRADEEKAELEAIQKSSTTGPVAAAAATTQQTAGAAAGRGGSSSTGGGTGHGGKGKGGKSKSSGGGGSKRAKTQH